MDILKRWLSLQVDLGKFDTRAAVYNFALKMTFRAVLLAFAFNLAFLPLGYALDLLPMSLADAVKLSVACSWLFGGAVSGALALTTGQVIHDLSVSRAEFERLSLTDMLSGLLNRRAFNAALGETGAGASLAILDLDRFKAVNDGYGHCAGDQVIKAVSDILREVFGPSHLVARLGGEEFGVIVRGGGVAQRIALVERARTLVETRAIHCDGIAIGMTISAGIAEFTPDRRPENVYTAADRALYQAKAGGRNRVIHETETAMPTFPPAVPDMSSASLGMVSASPVPAAG